MEVAAVDSDYYRGTSSPWPDSDAACSLRPITALWEPTPNAKCINTGSFMIYGFVYSAVNIASDLIIALMPLAFIWEMHRSRLEKVLLGCLMAAGLIATGASVARVVLITATLGRWSAWTDVLNDLLWGVELAIGVIAASLPCLKAPAHEMLRRLGIFHSKNAADASPESFLGHMSHGSHIMRQMNDIPLQGLSNEHVTPSSSSQTRPFGALGHPLEAAESRNTDATSLGGDSDQAILRPTVSSPTGWKGRGATGAFSLDV
ncbi:hypothetical protein MPH_13614 [Macrophomina phaseolina MS6]|uniref:Rhodopsin domain-containing protein n=1 Tax=Macrophomina phaseolina (strain MS6) TaxID=1126212 RepID=K2RY19_MACPH|nr:hypothetical protein MPH_13614 [Macrophomina phaseolina MS6]